MKMIERDMTQKLIECSKTFPVVTILGPRQSGKTTLARTTFKDYGYVNLEDPETFDFAQSDVNGFFATFKAPLIIDEIQRVPKLASKIQVLVDESGRNGQFILTGSFQQALKSTISQSLAGRTAILNLLPLSIYELNKAGYDTGRDEFMYQGFMPRLYSQGQPVDMLYSSYFQTYIERDVQSIVNVKMKYEFERFVRLLAGRVGQTVNLESLSNDVGASVTTIRNWISVLESSFVVFKVEPYYENFTKRLVKTPKIYFTDTGLLCYLLGIHSHEQVARDPLVGSIFENMAMLEILKAQFNHGREKSLYFFRDSKGFEVDAIMPSANGRFIPIEVKSSMTFSKGFTANLQKMEKFSGKAERPTVFYSGELEGESNGVLFRNYRHIGRFVEESSV